MIQVLGHQVVNLYNSHKTNLNKITLVALASFAFFSLQVPLPIILALKVSAVLSLSTVVFEHFFDKKHCDWIKISNLIPHKITCYFFASYFSSLMKVFLLSPLKQDLFLQEVTKLIAQKNLKMIINSLFIAPFCEEILFRGFLFERFVDLICLTSKYISYLSPDKITTIANIAQAIFFGGLHIIGGQVTDLKSKILVMIDTSLAGAMFGELKSTQGNLIYSICFHSLYNLRSTISTLIHSQT